MNNNKLSIKLLWYLTPLVILPLALLGVFALINVTESTEQQAESIVSHFVDQQTQKTKSYTQLYNSIMDLLSQSPTLNDYLTKLFHSKQQPIQELNAVMEEFNHYTISFPDILSIALVTPQNELITFLPQDITAQAPEYTFIEQLNNSAQLQQQFVLDDDQGRTSIYLTYKQFSTRFSLGQAELIGYLVVHLDPTEFNASVINTPFDDTFNFIIDSHGKVLFSNNGSLQSKHITEYELKKLTDQAQSEQFEEFTIKSIDQQNRMVIVKAMPHGLYYVSAVAKEKLYQSGKIISMYTALIIAATVILLPGIIFVVVKRLLLSPIALLGQASHRVGDGDLNIALPQNRHDEIGVLYQDFNHMVSQIKHYQTQLLDYREHLEEKVSARTQAIAKINKRLEHAITEAEQANHLKSRFLANMSHEIRTPLTAIMGFTESILEQEKNHKKANHLNTVLRNSKHLLELINNILDLSKIEAEKLELERLPVELIPLINDICSVIEPMAEDKSLNFDVEFGFPLPEMIHSDLTRLKQILLNICSNAVKFTEHGDVRLTIHYARHSDKMVFTVIDSGIGMSEQALARAFKPFEQADLSTTRKFGGTGLGLCISQNLAQLLGGGIQVTSQLSEGSKFEISIAANNTNKNVQQISHRYQHEQNNQALSINDENRFNAHILVAEDNPDNQELISLLLSQWGLTPDFAKNGAEAVEQALVNDYDLILMDMQMPVMGGLEATQMLRNAAYDGPIVALTANVMKHDVDSYLEAGCNKALAKPIDKQQLEQTLKHFLEIERPSDNNWEELFQGERFKQISDNYKAKLPALLEQVTQIYASDDLNELVSLAHSIKGSAGCFGFNHISDAASELESCIKQHNEEAVDYHVLKLEQSIIFSLKLDEN